MTIYVDIVFLENVLLNYIILISTAFISKRKIRYISFLISSCLGSLYAILNFVINLNVIGNIIFKLFISILMIIIAFKNLNLKSLSKALIMFYLTSFTFGGTSFMLLFLISPDSIIYNNGHFIGTYPLKIAIMGGIIGFIIIFIVAKIQRNRLNSNDLLCELEISYKGKNKIIKTLIDTGNLLKDPISNEDVIIVEKNSLKELVEENALKEIKNILNGRLLGKVSDDVYKYRFKLVPFTSLGNENGVLIAFKPDYIKIYSFDNKIVKNDVLIGIYDGRLSNSNLYVSLIGVNILKEVSINEYSTIA